MKVDHNLVYFSLDIGLHLPSIEVNWKIFIVVEQPNLHMRLLVVIDLASVKLNVFTI